MGGLFGWHQQGISSFWHQLLLEVIKVAQRFLLAEVGRHGRRRRRNRRDRRREVERAQHLRGADRRCAVELAPRWLPDCVHDSTIDVVAVEIYDCVSRSQLRYRWDSAVLLMFAARVLPIALRTASHQHVWCRAVLAHVPGHKWLSVACTTSRLLLAVTGGDMLGGLGHRCVFQLHAVRRHIVARSGPRWLLQAVWPGSQDHHMCFRPDGARGSTGWWRSTGWWQSLTFTKTAFRPISSGLAAYMY